MRRLILQTSVSIDGYVAALDGSHPWGEGSEDEAFKRWILDSVWAAGAHLMGRVTYEERGLLADIDERVRAADERDPQGRLLEDAGTRRLARDANRPRRSQWGDRESQARSGERSDRLRWRHPRPGAVAAWSARRVLADGRPG